MGRLDIQKVTCRLKTLMVGLHRNGRKHCAQSLLSMNLAMKADSSSGYYRPIFINFGRVNV